MNVSAPRASFTSFAAFSIWRSRYSAPPFSVQCSIDRAAAMSLVEAGPGDNAAITLARSAMVTNANIRSLRVS